MRLLIVLVVFIQSVQVYCQSLGDYGISVVEESLSGMPGLQSFAAGQYNGEWVLVGGRTVGLHRRQPWASFQENGNNQLLYVVDPETEAVWSAPLESLPASLHEQLQSSNMVFCQVDTTLYVAGGYGYSPTAGDHITFPHLTAVNLPGLMQAVKSGGNITPHFTQLTDERIQVTGGYMGFLEGRFYIIGGQNFTGRYNPMGPQHGPGFVQEYTNEIRSFLLNTTDGKFELANYEAIRDTANLHRRDLNVVPQIFPDGQAGFTAFSGVFQYDQDIPWLNTVDVTPDGYSVNNEFSQFLNQYHSAHVALYNPATKEMHTVFFGGISRFSLDSSGNLIDDPDVPFVKTISQVTRAENGDMTEIQIGEMPALLGSSAEFILHAEAPHDAQDIVNLSEISKDSLLLGYIVGGIESSLPHIFWINDGTQSIASSRIFKVYLVKGTASNIRELSLNPEGYFDIQIFPNPVREEVKIEFSVRRTENVRVVILDKEGQQVKQVRDATLSPGRYQFSAECNALPPGTYIVQVNSEQLSASRQFVVQ